MSENVCLAVDSCCDLPAEFIQRNNIRVLPIFLKFGDKIFTDNRDLRKTIDFYKRGMLEKSIDAESVPVSALEMSKILEHELVLKYDRVLAIAISSTRSQVYKNIRDAVFVSQPKFKELRGSKGLSRDFRISVLDSQNIFPGQGVLVHEAVRLLQQEEATVEDAMARLETIKNRVQTFIVPQDLYHLKNRARTKGDKSVGGLRYVLGRLLNIKPIILCSQGQTNPVDKAIGFGGALKKVFRKAEEAIDKGLSVNVVNMSYAGDLGELQREPAFQQFISYTQSRNIPTLVSVMSTTGAINVGPRCFALSYAD